MSSTVASLNAATDMAPDLRPVIAPLSIALIGASDTPGRPTARPLQFLQESEYEGDLFIVNPRRETVAGHRSYPNVSALPSVPEHALVMTPAATVPGIVEECARLGVHVVSILSDGFAEAGPAGRRLQEQIIGIARRTGIRLLGPNSIGLVNVAEHIPMTGNAVFGDIRPKAGGTFLVSQSGSMIGSLVTRGEITGTAFSAVVSSGGEIDLSAGDLGLGALEDPRTTEILLFLEHIEDAPALARLGRKAAGAKIPVVAFKLGRTMEASELAISHTGALAGEDDLTEQLLVENGIARVKTLTGLLSSAPLLRSLPLRRPAEGPLHIGVLTTTGGAAAMVVDELATRGCTVAQASTRTMERLREAGIEAHATRIVDLTLAGAHPDVLGSAVEILGQAKEFDSLIVVLGSSARLTPVETTAAVIDAARGPVPVSVFLVPEAPEARARLQEAGIPVFTQAEVAADVYAAAEARELPPEAERIIPRSAPGASRVLNEADSYARLSSLGIRPAKYLVLDAETDGELPSELGDIAYPCAVKILDALIPHKSDMGGVVLGVRDEAELRRAAETVARRADEYFGRTAPRRLLVQRMSSGGVGEILLGYRNDKQIGPVVLAAGGGIQAELYQDRTMRLAPLDFERARQMLGDLKVIETLTGFRNLPRGDIDGVAEMLVSLSQLAEDPEVLEAEINPVLVSAESVTPVDCFVRLADAERQ